ncbi:serine recombinase [Pelosinus sp. IPA-1]|nr:serine recombinase [Pelosinus sp. IPA-1]
MRTALYARYSSDNQREESITAQLRAGREYCKHKKYKIVEEYTDEAFSARTDSRPSFQRMIADAKRGLFDVIVFHKIDRNARNEYDYYRYKAQLQDLNVRLEYVMQNIDDSPEGNMMESMLVGMAAYYSRNLSVEVKKGLRENAYQAIHTGGKPPLGYDVDPTTKKLVINEAEANIIRLIFTRRAAGFHYGKIIDELNLLGYKTKFGNNFGKNSLHDLFKNKKYIGTFIFGRVAGGHNEKRNSHKESDAKIEIPNAIPAIISEDLFMQVQNRMTEDKHSPGSGKAKEIYTLSGLVYCECGAKMAGGRVTSRGNVYSYYRCDKQQRTLNNCGTGRVKKEELEKMVLDKIETEILSPDAIPRLTEVINAEIELLMKQSSQKLSQLKSVKKELETKVSKLLDLAEQGLFDDLLKERYKNSVTQLERTKEEIAEIEQASAALLTKEQVSETINNQAQLEKTPENIRSLCEVWVDKIIVKNEEISISLRFAFDWWRRGESNSCPKASLHRLLRAHSVF